MKHVYVSPHADDVALSCGGRIITQPNRADETLILNMFTSDRPQEDWPSGELERTFTDAINPVRTAEDKAAWDSIGIGMEQAGLPEALLRKRFPVVFLGDGDDGIVDRVYDVLLRYVGRFPDAAFYFPAGIGNHIDHLACTKAALRLLEKRQVERIFLYEDTPYCWLRSLRHHRYRALARRVHLDSESRAKAFRPDGINLVEYIKRNIVFFPRGKKLFPVLSASLAVQNVAAGWIGRSQEFHGKLILLQLDDGIVAQKIDLLFHYGSQIPMLFGINPEEVLRFYRNCLSTEAVVEISRSGAAG